MDLTKYLLDEAKRHLNIAPQDIKKLCYQAAFGAEHILNDISKAQAYFYDEYSVTPIDNKPLAEYIAPNVCRVNLSAWKRCNLDPNWLWNLFSKNNKNGSETGVYVYNNYLKQARKLIQAGAFPFTCAQWDEYIENNIEGLVRHSDTYRVKERPAYRVLSGWSVSVIPIIQAMAGLFGGVIAIDGRAASGKTTFAKRFADIVFGNPSIIIKMDDFFLPPMLRTTARLAQPGGNVHYERFKEEVLPYIKGSEGFKYKKFDCSIMNYNGDANVSPHPWRIVEGVYSFHPALGDYMDISIFMDVEPDKQRELIEKRNNPKIASNYLAKWIPMEETYFATLINARSSRRHYIHISNQFY